MKRLEISKRLKEADLGVIEGLLDKIWYQNCCRTQSEEDVCSQVAQQWFCSECKRLQDLFESALDPHYYNRQELTRLASKIEEKQSELNALHLERSKVILAMTPVPCDSKIGVD